MRDFETVHRRFISWRQNSSLATAVVHPSGAIIGGYHHSPSDGSLSTEFISVEAPFGVARRCYRRLKTGGSRQLWPPSGRARMEGFVVNADFRAPLIEMPMLFGHEQLSDGIDFTTC